MTKAEIIDAVYEKVGGFSKKESAEIVEAVFDTMKEVLADGKKIKISGFGNFVVRAKKQRIGLSHGGRFYTVTPHRLRTRCGARDSDAARAG